MEVEKTDPTIMTSIHIKKHPDVHVSKVFENKANDTRLAIEFGLNAAIFIPDIETLQEIMGEMVRYIAEQRAGYKGHP